MEQHFNQNEQARNSQNVQAQNGQAQNVQAPNVQAPNYQTPYGQDRGGHNRNNKRSSSFLALVVVIAIIASFFGGQLWAKRQYSIMDVEGFRLLQSSYERIHEKFLYDIDDEKLMNGAISGMVNSLEDQYSRFLPDEQGEEYVGSYEGQFYGIGAEIRQEEGRYFITTLVKDMPAEKAGLKPDDEIVAVDRQEIAGLSFQELLSKVRGDKGTKVIIGVQRAGVTEVLDFEMQRAEIPVHSVYSERLEHDIGVITITGFKQKTDQEFAEALQQLQAEGELKGLIIDLRSNPGGLLTQTIEIANSLIPQGKKILDVVFKNESRTQSYVARKQEKFTAPIAVLINEYSASASEVLSAALKESADAYIVGVTSYGKGVVQSYEEFRDNSVLILTEAEWKTPSGNSIHKVGVEPTHRVELPAYASLHGIPSDVELKTGSYGEYVELLSQYLQVLGYRVSKEGIFDNQLEQALKQYEAAKGLTVDGVYTAKDGAAMVEDIRALLADNDTQLKKAVELLEGSNS